MCRDCQRNTCKELPRLGVRLDFLERFIADNNIPSDWTTEKVVNEKVLPQTKSWERYTDVIEAKYPEEGYVGPEPSVFISHAWNRPFVELVMTLSRGRLYGKSNRKKYVWLDIFTVHQHPGKYKQMDLRTIIDCIRTIGYTVVILDNGISPEKFTLTEEVSEPVALTRIWCLFEIWNTIRYGGEVRLISSSILFGGVGRCGWFTRRPFEVSCLNAEASRPEDLARNLAQMEHSKVVCTNETCSENQLLALPYANVLKIIKDASEDEKWAHYIKCNRCNRCQQEDFNYYVLFCNRCKINMICRDCCVSKTTMITLVDKTINDGILRLWALQRFYLIYVVGATAMLVVGAVYGVKRTIIEGDKELDSVHEAMVFGIYLFLVMTMFLILFACAWKMAHMARYYRFQLSEIGILKLYIAVSVFVVVCYYLRFSNDEEDSYTSYTILSFCICFLYLLTTILTLYRTRSLSRRCRINLTPGTWTWFFLFCWCYYPNCLSWLLCDCVWVKGHRHKPPRKLCKNMEAFCYKLLKPCSMCFACGRPRGISHSEINEPLL